MREVMSKERKGTVRKKEHFEHEQYIEAAKAEMKKEGEIKTGGKAFWDSDYQRVNAFKYAARRGLVLKNNLPLMIAVRAYYREKEKVKLGTYDPPARNLKNPREYYDRHKKKGKAMYETVGMVNAQTSAITPATAITPEEAKGVQQRRGFIASYDVRPRKGDSKPIMTNRVWKGEHYENGKWTMPEHPRTDYYGWYMEFLFRMRPDAIPLGKIHEQWSEEFESDDRVMMFKPRDHYKTTFLTVGYTVYQLCEHQNNLWPVLIVSKADTNTKDVFQAIRQHLEENEILLSFYGYMINEELSNTSESIFTLFQFIGSVDPCVYCATFGAKKVMGTHPRMAMLDDIEESMLSKAMMRQAKNLLDRSLMGGLPKGSKLCLIGTLKGYDETNDIYLYEDKKGTFSVYKDPAVYKINPMTKEPVLDEHGQKIYGMPDMKNVFWKKKKIPVFNDDGTPKLGWQGKPKFKFDIYIEILNDADKEWMSIYPERYTVVDIIRKRIEMRNTDEENDDAFWAEFFLIPVKPGGNFFLVDRIMKFPPTNFSSTNALFQYLIEYHIPSVVWIDPGGKKGHGIAMACVCFMNGNKYVLDLAVIKKGVIAAAELLARWVPMYNIDIIGCEGNFEQKETFAESIERELERYCVANECPACFRKVLAIHNTGDKILRIQTHMNIMLGKEGTPSDFFVNQDASAYSQFISETSMFPLTLPGMDFEWDLLDCITSAKIHLFNITSTVKEVFSYN
jgi:hypothetical protein